MSPELLPLPTAVNGERVRVRPYRRGDGGALFEAIDEDRPHLRAWLPWVDAHKTVADSEVYARKASAWWILREDLPVLIESHEGRLLGGSGLHRLDWAARCFEIGYWIRKSAEGRGFASEAARLVSAIAFDRLGATRVQIRCDLDNDRSAAVPRRLGFEEEGTVVTRDDDLDREMRVFALAPDSYRACEWAPSASRAVEVADRDG
ncbi:MAG: GNAT family N-acetyltransferase [Polyangiaceae bacterium]